MIRDPLDDWRRAAMAEEQRKLVWVNRLWFLVGAIFGTIIGVILWTLYST